jgi:homoisocitrate dehydrogenase
MTHRICIIEGDGIGHEVIPVAVKVLQTAAPDLEMIPAELGWDCFRRRGTAIPKETWEAIRSCKAVLLGAVSAPSYKVEGYRAAILTLRQELDLYANLRPVFSPPIPGARPGVNLLIVRENTEGLYVGQERSDGEVAVARRIITRRASFRIAHLAFRVAQKEGRRKVTVVHKANVLPETCGLFRQVALEVAGDYPQVKVEEMLVDAMAMRLAKDPENFDVILTTNLFGDILSDEASVWGGGLGMAPSLNLGEEMALAEPVHGSAPDIAGKGIANPLAAILSGALLLRHKLGLGKEAKRVEQAVMDTLAKGFHTPDIPGKGEPIGTEKMGELVVEKLKEGGSDGDDHG